MTIDDTRLAAARALLAVDRTDAALAEVHRVLAERPDDTDAWCVLAMCHRRGGDIPNALQAARRAAALAPDGEWTQRLLAEMLRKSGRHREAVAAARRAVALAPLEWRTHMSLVHALLDQGGPELAGAREPVARTLALAPDVADGYVLAGRVYARLDQPDLAREHWTRALELDPGNTAAQTLLARDDLAQGRTDAGVGRLRAVLGQDPTNPAVPATVARIRVELVWRAARRAALACTVLVAGLLALSGTGVRLWLAPVALALGLGAQVLGLRGYPEGRARLPRDARRDAGPLRLGALCLAAQLLVVAWAGLAPDPLHLGLFTVPVYALLALVLLTPLLWLLGEYRRPTVAALYRLTRRR